MKSNETSYTNLNHAPTNLKDNYLSSQHRALKHKLRSGNAEKSLTQHRLILNQHLIKQQKAKI